MHRIIATSVDTSADRSDLEAAARQRLATQQPNVPEEAAAMIARNQAERARRAAVLASAATTSWIVFGILAALMLGFALF